MNARTRYAPHLLLTAMIAIWGGSYAAVKVALGALPPFTVIALRFWIAVLCVLPFLGRGVGGELRATRRPGLLAGAALTIGYLLQTVGMNETSASMGGFLAGLIVLLVGLGGFLLFRSRFGRLSVAGFALGVVGLLLLCWPGGDGERTDTLRGILLQVGSMTAYAVHILLVSRFGRGAPALAFCLWQLVLVALVGTGAAWLADDRLTGVDWNGPLLFAIVYLGVLATALGIGVQAKVQHRIPPVHVALLFAMQPLFAALVAWATLGDRMGAMQLAGGVTIVVAVLLTSLDRQ
ncbi:MAG: DMT family transporter [Planctomycetes bacterium]|nr:DMT family transporter [Planctomycetota bacterium]